MSERCDICGEDFFPETKGDGKAEMYDPVPVGQGLVSEGSLPTIVCHYSCGQGIGWEVA